MLLERIDRNVATIAPVRQNQKFRRLAAVALPIEQRRHRMLHVGGETGRREDTERDAFPADRAWPSASTARLATSTAPCPVPWMSGTGSSHSRPTSHGFGGP